jgi:hypothetical protein
LSSNGIFTTPMSDAQARSMFSEPEKNVFVCRFGLALKAQGIVRVFQKIDPSNKFSLSTTLISICLPFRSHRLQCQRIVPKTTLFQPWKLSSALILEDTRETQRHMSQPPRRGKIAYSVVDPGTESNSNSFAFSAVNRVQK